MSVETDTESVYQETRKSSLNAMKLMVLNLGCNLEPLGKHLKNTSVLAQPLETLI